MVVYGPSSCTRLFYKLFFSIYVKEIKIATGDAKNTLRYHEMTSAAKFMVLLSKLAFG